MQETADEALLLKNQLCFPLYAAARRITGAYTPYLRPLGLTYTQYLVLLVLWEENGIAMSALCGRLLLDSGTLTPVLKRMEAAGLLTRERCADDERRITISLTETGRSLREKVQEIPREIARCVPLSPADAAELYRLLYLFLGEGQTAKP